MNPGEWVMRARTVCFYLIAVGLALGCADDSTAGSSGWEARVDTVGDTIRVHTVSGSELGGVVDLIETARIGRLEGKDEEIFGGINGLAEDGAGNIYVFDRQATALRKYGPDGAYVATLGHKGGGPGEYANSDGGMAVLPDGRIVLRDPGNARFTLYKPDGSYDSEWLGRGGFFTSQPLVVDASGNAYTSVIRETRDGEEPWPNRMWVMRVLRMSADGTPLDTLDIPRYHIEPKVIIAQRDGGTSVNDVPFTGQFFWAVHPSGAMLTALGDRYAVDLHRVDGTVLRMTRDTEPIAVLPDEKAEAEAGATRNMRGMVPDWRWNGPPIPDTKAPITGLRVGQDGRIWVQLATRAERIPEEERLQLASPDPESPPPLRFRTPVVFDVFEPDGRYLGQVRTPRGFAVYPQPVFEKDHVWAVVRDELDVSYVVKFTIGTAATPP
jgi:hypothetical protein